MTSNLTKNAKSLRKNATKAETLLWSKIRSRQWEGVKFRRQQPIDNYIVDFVSFEKQIIIELDGGQHADLKREDRQRDKRLNEDGYTVLRFWNNDVFEKIDAILETIRLNCLK
jgi:very-short-patch-repair endonuclease